MRHDYFQDDVEDDSRGPSDADDGCDVGKLVDSKYRIRRAMLRITAPKVTLQRWRAADGRSIRICEMSDRHLENLIALIARSPESKAAHTVRDRGLMSVLLDERDRRDLAPAEGDEFDPLNGAEPLRERPVTQASQRTRELLLECTRSLPNLDRY